MREIFTYGSVGGASGNRRFYLETDRRALGSCTQSIGLDKLENAQA
jgi:hypothetical protein